MKRVTSLVKIEKEIEKLSADEQLKLIEKLVRRVRKASGQSKAKSVSKRELSWKKLYGLGKELWKRDCVKIRLKKFIVRLSLTKPDIIKKFSMFLSPFVKLRVTESGFSHNLKNEDAQKYVNNLREDRA